MHIPDGFLSGKVSAVSSAASFALLALAAGKLDRRLKSRAVPLVGVTAAFVFAAQMVNFPVPGGVSGHLLGSTLCAVVLGPGLGSVAMALVLIVQCFFLHDGGITALGANVFNMAFVGVIVSWIVLRSVRALVPGRKGLHLAVALASWISVELAALFASLEIGMSGAAPLPLVVWAMLGVHAVIGVGEAVLTDLIVLFLYEVEAESLAGLGAKAVER
jgi:cobalt/nickel transport system permease protein